jgi:hypothetical protein
MLRNSLIFTAVSAAVAISTVAVVLMAGCAGSSLKYSSKNSNPSSPPDGGFAFALHATTVALAASPAAARDDGTHGGTDARASKAAPLTVPTANSCSSPPLPTPIPADYGPPVWWRDCLRGISASAVAISSTDTVYVAIPDNGLFSKTVATPKASDSDPLMLTSITFNTSSTIPSTITAAGAGAASGFVFGPWGAAAGAIVGAAGTWLPGTTSRVGPLAHQDWWTFVCDGDKEYERYGRLQKQLKSPASATLALPVTLDVALADDKTPDKPSSPSDACWNSLPTNGGAQGNAPDDIATEATGWFYRFVPDQNTNGPKHLTLVPPVIINRGVDPPQLPVSIKPAHDYFTPSGSESVTKGKTSFPVSACRAVDLQITWWQEFDSNVKNLTHTIQFNSYSLIVADARYVQVIDAPTHGSMTLLPVCGGYSSSGTPSTDMADSISNLIKQVQAVKDAETKWATPAKK